MLDQNQLVRLDDVAIRTSGLVSGKRAPDCDAKLIVRGGMAAYSIERMVVQSARYQEFLFYTGRRGPN